MLKFNETVDSLKTNLRVPLAQTLDQRRLDYILDYIEKYQEYILIITNIFVRN